MGLLDFLSPEAGQDRRRWLDSQDAALAEALRYYLGPTGIPERIGVANEVLNPVVGLQRSAAATNRAMDPSLGGVERVAAGADAVTEALGALLGVSGLRATTEAAAPAVERGLIDFIGDESGALRLFHGSPHDFDKFSMTKLGTGEGAQVYGHGLYFAESEPIARWYRDALSRGVFYRGKPVASAHPMDNAQAGAIHSVAKGVADGTPADKAIAFEAGQWRAYAEPYLKAAQTDPKNAQLAQQRAQTLLNIADEIERLNPNDFLKNPGRVYEVNVNANPEDFLDWDKPLSEQPQGVLEALAKVDTKAGNMTAKDRAETISAALSGDPRLTHLLRDRTINATGDTVYKGLVDSLGAMDWPVGANAATRKEFYAKGAGNASEALREAGIPGIRYLDAGSRGAGEGSRNYVVFDDKLIDIVRKYGIAGAATLLGLSQSDIAQAMEKQQQPKAAGLLDGVR